MERTYNVPLRKEFMKVPKYKRTKKAVTALREFLQKHMKADTVKLGKNLNEHMWKNGIKRPPHHVKITAVKEDDVVKAELFGHEYREFPYVPVESKKEQKQPEKEPKKPENKEEKKETKQEKPKKENQKKEKTSKEPAEKTKSKPKSSK